MWFILSGNIQNSISPLVGVFIAYAAIKYIANLTRIHLKPIPLHIPHNLTLGVHHPHPIPPQPQLP